MGIFATIIGATVALSVSLWGVGRMLRHDDAPAAAVLRGWAVLMAVGALAWFGKFPAAYLAPVLWLLIAAGLLTAVRQLPRTVLAGALLGGAVIGASFALPFALQPGLLAYAHWGSDQWGYAAVSRWLVLHSVNELPVIDYKPGLDWVWKVLITRERPLIYLELAAVASAFGVKTVVACYVLPAAAMTGVFLAFFIGPTPLRISAVPWRWVVSLGVALQPILWLHFQHQFLGGVMAGAMGAILVTAVCEGQLRAPGDPIFFATAAVFAVLAGGLYSTLVSWVLLAMLAVVGGASWGFGPNRPRMAPREWSTAAGLLLLAGGIFWAMHAHSPSAPGTPSGTGAASHLWAQGGALFGLTEITPWYQRTGSLGALGVDPANHLPAGSALGAALLVALGFFLAAQCWLWWRQKRDATPFVLACAAVAGLAAALPPRGDNVVLSRALPIFGGMLLVVLAATAALEQPRWRRCLVLGLVCLPLVRAAPGMWSLLARPANTMIAGEWQAPPNRDTWGALAYAYFYQDERDIDWTLAPEAFAEMTHYMPPELRPKMRREK